MINIEMLEVNNQMVQGVRIVAPGGEGHPNMLVILCKKGYIMCGYLNQAAAETFGDAAVVVGGSNFDEILKNPVKAVSPEAEKLGVKVGMSGMEAAAALNA